MRTYALILGFAISLVLGLALALPPTPPAHAENTEWHFNGTVIEACSCPMFCQCYFNTTPALHDTEHGPAHFCKFNMAYKVNKGHYGNEDLTGVKFWVAGDLGHDWREGHTEWAIITFQQGTTELQKQGVLAALTNIFPVKWGSFAIADDNEISWSASEDRAEAKLANGQFAEIILNKWQGMGGETGVLQNIAYFGAPRNTGFKMMPNEIETWKVDENRFEFKGTTGFMVTVDMRSSDLAM